jgi:hypothetical protein
MRDNGWFPNECRIDFDFGSLYRLSNEEFRTVKYMEVTNMDGMCDPVDKRRQESTDKEQAKERKVGADYMRQRHGLVESREPAYRPVGKMKKGKY